jgi:hypothetical protein
MVLPARQSVRLRPWLVPASFSLDDRQIRSITRMYWPRKRERRLDARVEQGERCISLQSGSSPV